MDHYYNLLILKGGQFWLCVVMVGVHGCVCLCHRPYIGVDMAIQVGGAGEGQLFGLKI